MTIKPLEWVYRRHDNDFTADAPRGEYRLRIGRQAPDKRIPEYWCFVDWLEGGTNALYVHKEIKNFKEARELCNKWYIEYESQQ